MRTLFVVVLVAALGWSGYWWAGSRAKEAALSGWLAEQRAAGWVADADLTVRGFPNRFDTMVTDLHLADPRSGWSWTAPAFQILALSYRPNHIIAVWPPRQTVSSPAERITVEAERMRGSVRFAPNTGLALRQALVELKSVSLVSNAGWRAGISEGQVAIRRAPAGAAPDYGYDVSLTAQTLRLPEPLRARLDPAGVLPASVNGATIRLTPVFDAEWDRRSVEAGLPQLTTLNVGNVSFAWGDMELTVMGRLDADTRGRAEGTLNVTARNWREMLQLGVRAGWLTQDIVGSVEAGLGILARLTGETERLDMTVTFGNGLTRIGPVPIGPAPQLRAPRVRNRPRLGRRRKPPAPAPRAGPDRPGGPSPPGGR
ncbi:MAG: DUF2125 domain-containing protein, partial [Pseudomonadota bacterium]